MQLRAPFFLGLLVLAACNAPESSPTPDPSTPPAPEPTVPPPDTSTPTDPVPVPLSLVQRFHREGVGEGFALATTDVDRDGSDEILYGGRGFALLDATSRARFTPRWQIDWPKTGTLAEDGDNTFVTAMGAFHLGGDEVTDALVVDTRDRAHAVDGVTGALAWTADLGLDFAPLGLAFVDGNGDGVLDFYPSGGHALYDGTSGAKLWEHVMPFAAVHVHEAELDGQPGDDLLIVREIDSGIGLPSSGGEVTVYARAADGTLLWEAETSTSPVTAIPADLDGDGVDEAVVCTQDAVVAVGPSGLLWAMRLSDGFGLHLAATDTDGDGRDEVAIVRGFGVRGGLHLIDDDGTELWVETLPTDTNAVLLAELDGDGILELVTASGTNDLVSSGGAMAWDLDIPRDHLLWEADTWLTPQSLAFADIDGQDVVLVGGDTTVLQALDPATGTAVFDWSGGGFVTTVVGADLDGDGADEVVVHGDDAGQVVASDAATGDELWRTRLSLNADGIVTGLAAGDADGDDVAEVVATGVSFEGYAALQVLQGGQTKWMSFGDGSYTAPHLVDLDGDKILEIVVGNTAPGACAVQAFEASGRLRWTQQVGPCLDLFLDVGDADGDGVPEVAYGDTDVFGPWHVALIDAEGQTRWSHTLKDRTSEWVEVVQGGLLHGGWTADPEGHVTLRDAKAGLVIWEHRPATTPEPDDPGFDIPSGVTHGLALPDLDGDGSDEVLISHHAGETSLLEGATGTPRWTVRTEPADTPWGDRHTGASLAYVPARDGQPDWLVLAEDSTGRARSTVWAYDLDGQPLASWPRDGWGTTAATTSFGAVVGGGLGVTGVGAE